LRRIARLMGEDKHTEWELRYYVYTADQARANSDSTDWDGHFCDELDSITNACKKYKNIKVVGAEVYGELEWSLESKRENVTRVITPSNTLWPPCPEDVAWRTKSSGV
ncbi:hypothetical protein K458DRAFT_288840, partial [Lentithecium fluviatile CBS 122367]